MKKSVLNILFAVLPLSLFAECPVVQPVITNPGTSIECWGDDYEKCTIKEWQFSIPEDYNYVEFEYIIDLNPGGAIDALHIYTEDENHTEHDVLNYNYQPMTGSVQAYTSNHVFRIVLLSVNGNSGEIYRGFKLSYRYMNTGTSDQVIYSNLGVGIQPQERLHVNGPVRGDGESGSWRIRTTEGTTEIGAANANYSHFYTDRPAFFFSKPLYIAGGKINPYGQEQLELRTDNTTRLTIDNNGHVGIGTDEPEETLHINGYVRGNGTLGAQTIRTDAGTTTIGAQGWSYSHFHTSLPRFYFYKPIMVANGEISSGADQNLYFKTFNTNINETAPTTWVTILNSNGNVGIGTNNPNYKLEVNGNLLATDIHSTKLRATDSVTTSNIKATNIVADDIYVRSTSGADFVFDSDYNLRSLQETKAFINTYKHLPEIPSAEEMQENGVSLDKLVILLLQKVEELTIYTIQQDEIIKELESLISK